MSDQSQEVIEKATMRKVFWRIIPYTFTPDVISYLDRANIDYAAVQMNKELAKWLTESKRNWLTAELKRDQDSRSNEVLYLSLIYFIYQVGNLGIGMWMRQIIKGLTSGLANFQIGLVAMIPAVATSTAAVSITALNSIGNLGGFAGPYAIGYIKDLTGSAYGDLLVLSGLLIISFVMTWFARMANKPETATVTAEAHA